MGLYAQAGNDAPGWCLETHVMSGMPYHQWPDGHVTLGLSAAHRAQCAQVGLECCIHAGTMTHNCEHGPTLVLSH